MKALEVLPYRNSAGPSLCYAHGQNSESWAQGVSLGRNKERKIVHMLSVDMDREARKMDAQLKQMMRQEDQQKRKARTQLERQERAKKVRLSI